MKRGGPLKRRTELKAAKPMERRAEPHRGGSQLARTKLRSTSKKRERENRERTAMKRENFPAGTRCAKPGCWKPYEDVHEPLTRARGGSITDPNNAVPLCRPHHDDVGKEEPWAYELGLLLHSWEKTDLAILASVRQRLLAGEVPVEDIAYCHHCRAWLPTDHDCGRPEEEDAA